MGAVRDERKPYGESSDDTQPSHPCNAVSHADRQRILQMSSIVLDRSAALLVLGDRVVISCPDPLRRFSTLSISCLVLFLLWEGYVEERDVKDMVRANEP